MATRGPDHILGTAIAVAFDGLGAQQKQSVNKRPAVNVEADQGPSKATANAINWNSVSGQAKAFRNPAAPAIVVAGAVSISTARSHFELTVDDPRIRFGTELGMWAELTDGGAARVIVEAEIAPAGGAPVATLPATYDLRVDATDPTGKTLAIMGGKPGHTRMVNGGHQSEPDPAAPSYTTLVAGNYELTLTLTVMSTGFAENITAEVTVHIH